MIKKLWCWIWGHDWQAISVKEVRARGGAYAVLSVSECRRCRKLIERRKMVEPLEALKGS